MVTVEAFVDGSVRTWHACFGMSGCLNDFNIVECSNLLINVVEEKYHRLVHIVYQRYGVNRRFGLLMESIRRH